MLYGFDLGGTKIEFSVYDQKLNLLANQRVETPADDYQAFLKIFTDTVLKADEEFGCRGMVGIGFPGAINPKDDTLICANLPGMNGKPLQKDLEQLIDRRVAIQNDANCFLISECYGGAADGCSNVLGVTLGTGVGGALFVNGNVVSGLNFFAGEIGHYCIPATMTEKYPDLPLFVSGLGHKGSLETYSSGTGLANIYNHFADEPKKGPEILALYREKDDVALKAVDIYLEVLAAGLSTSIMVLDPEAIVFGGGLAAFEDIYSELPKRLPAKLIPNVQLPKISKAQFGGAGGVRGAALLNYRQ
ncbi:ROK family protein [Motilimonas pumila]|uniref:N-acetylglucosamine kinase n=1 Tax=Motilimonas pumila TaxID=2303987 RepID=A0A418YK77_9GAMM|nr:ROK family protein [Motilimonas pumila]RJG51366.1 ROK family protein [Motilimonas pumila]